MGLILNSSILVAAERGGDSVRAILQRVQATQADTDRERRRAFAEELCRAMTVHPVTLEIAQLAGRVEGEQAARGVSIPSKTC